MIPVVLFRSDFFSRTEETICQKIFPTYTLRSYIPDNSLVIGRYSVLPFYNELCYDLATKNCKLINTYGEHRYIANFDWYQDIHHLTPRSWFDTSQASQAFNDMPKGMILKGRTNSMKIWEWMYADTKEKFWKIDKMLHEHELIAPQGIVYREYVPLEVIEEPPIPGGHKFVNEWRCFFYKEHLLNFGYYWTMASDEAIERANSQNLVEMLLKAREAAKILAHRATFFVVDVAKTAEGRWIIIEVNDGQMSGLSMCDPNILYENLKLYVR